MEGVSSMMPASACGAAMLSLWALRDIIYILFHKVLLSVSKAAQLS